MATTEESKCQPEAVLRLTELDVTAVLVLSRYWIETVEQRDNEVLMELYAKE